MEEYKPREFSQQTSAKADIAAQGFMTKVYMWMGAGLALTAVMAYYVSHSYTILSMLFSHNGWPFYGLLIAELGVVFYLSARIASLSPSTATALFFVYSAVNGVTIAPIVLIYTQESIASAFFCAAGMFGAMSVYGTITKRDLSGMKDFLIMGLIGLIIASVVNMFMRSERTSLVISVIGVIVFTLLTAYDTQKIRRIGREFAGNEEMGAKASIMGALSLYLDFINMFLYLLRIFGKRR